MPTHKSNDYKLSLGKYYLSHSKNKVHTCISLNFLYNYNEVLIFSVVLYY